MKDEQRLLLYNYAVWRKHKNQIDISSISLSMFQLLVGVVLEAIYIKLLDSVSRN